MPNAPLPPPATVPPEPTPVDLRRLKLVAIGLGWLGAAATAAVSIAIGHVVDAMRDGADISAATYLAGIAGTAIAGLTAWSSARIARRAAGHRELELRHKLGVQLFHLGLPFRTDRRSGRFVSTATDGVERSANYQATFVGPMIAAMTTPILAILAIGFFINWPIAGWLALALPVIPIVVGGFQMMFRKVSQEYRATSRRFAATFLDELQGLPTAALANATERRGESLAGEAEGLRRQVMRLLAGNQVVLFVVDAAFSLAIITAGTGLAAQRLIAGDISAGQAIALVLIFTILIEPLERVGEFFYIGMAGRAARKEIEATLALEPTVPVAQAPSADSVSFTSDDAATASPPPAVRLRNVTMTYPDGTVALRLDSLDVARGEHVAIIGPSGSGKTTLADLIQTQLWPSEGTVHLDGIEVTAKTITRARSQVATVAQSTMLFTGTIAENLRLAQPGATDDELWDVLTRAQLADEIRALGGLETRVGERGASLSGGQAQRLAVARALLRDAPILVLDEPTSQVDGANEQALVAALDVARQGRTVVTIAHRLTTVRGADRIIVLSGGSIATQGAPSELGDLERYYSMATMLAAAEVSATDSAAPTEGGAQ